MGIGIEYPLGYASSGDSLFRDTGTYYLVPAPILLQKALLLSAFLINCCLSIMNLVFVNLCFLVIVSFN